jgi:TRAP-type transport system periplasmic protein
MIAIFSQIIFIRFRLHSIALFAFLIIQSQTPHAYADKIEIHFAHNGGAGSLYEASATEFARLANERLPGSHTVIAVGNSGLGDDVAVLGKIRNGQVAMGLLSSVMSTVSDKFGIFELPFLIRDRAQIQRVGLTLLDQHLQPEVNRKGYRIIGLWENGFRHITNNVRPIKYPDDLRGLKIRIPPGVWREKLFRALGAEPIPLPLHETYEALRSGQVDGQENPLQQIKGSKFIEVQRYLTYSAHIYTPAFVVVGHETFAKLPESVQEVLASTAAGMQGWVYQQAMKIESDLIDDFEEAASINQLDIKAFNAAARPLYGEFIKSVEGGAKMITLVTGMNAADGTR